MGHSCGMSSSGCISKSLGKGGNMVIVLYEFERIAIKENIVDAVTYAHDLVAEKGMDKDSFFFLFTI